MTDWCKIQQAFTGGNASVREIARGNCVSEGTIRARAKALGWVRLTAATTPVPSAPAALGAMPAVPRAAFATDAAPTSAAPQMAAGGPPPTVEIGVDPATVDPLWVLAAMVCGALPASAPRVAACRALIEATRQASGTRKASAAGTDFPANRLMGAPSGPPEANAPAYDLSGLNELQRRAVERLRLKRERLN